MGSWVAEREPPLLTELCEQSPSPSCNSQRSGLCHPSVSLEDVDFFFFLILSKTKSRPPAGLLCRGWVLGEPSPSPSETPGRHSTSQHLPVCSPVRILPPPPRSDGRFYLISLDFPPLPLKHLSPPLPCRSIVWRFSPCLSVSPPRPSQP